MAALPPGVTRSRIPLMVRDFVRITNPAIIRKVSANKDIGRPAEADLPLILRAFFSSSKFYHVPEQSFALPMVGNDRNDSAARRRAIQGQLATGFTDAHINQLLELVKSNKTEAEVGKECAKIVGDLILPLPDGQRLPDDIATAAYYTLETFTQAFNPYKLLRARSSRRKVEDYLATILNNAPYPTDYAHNLGAAAQGLARGIVSMREMATDDIHVHFNNNPIVTSVLRVPLVDTTLDGMFPEDNPLLARSSLILMDVADAATETQDDLFLFGTGIEPRQCPFKGLFFTTTTEVKERMVSSGTS